MASFSNYNNSVEEARSLFYALALRIEKLEKLNKGFDIPENLIVLQNFEKTLSESQIFRSIVNRVKSNENALLIELGDNIEPFNSEDG